MVNKFVAILRLLRVQQYYKNVILFIGVFFSGNLLNFTLYPSLILGFVLVCLVSSLTYIQNDIHDIENDKIHPEKQKSRPLAAGDLTKIHAWILFSVIAVIEIAFVIYFHDLFSLFLILIYVNGLLYNYIFKNYPFADIIALSMLYVWRTLTGCAIIQVDISPWLIIMTFLAAMFLVLCKRIADLEILGEENASKHKKIYDFYSKQLLQMILTMIATSLIIIYALYCVLGPTSPTSIIPPGNSGILIYSLPFALYLVIRYMYLTFKNPEIARNTERVIKDPGMVIGAILLALTLLITFEYLKV